MKTKITKEQSNLIKNILLACYLAFLVARIDIYPTNKKQPETAEAKTQSYETTNDTKRVVSEVKSHYPISPTPNAIPDAKEKGKEQQKIGDTNNIPTKQEIENYIREVFGEHAEKAFLLLKGKGEGSCAENRNLDVFATNDNTKWGGMGKDWGLFQINDFYHPVFKLNLHKDWKANVDYAFKMFKNDGYTFYKRWTAGKCLKWQGFEI